MAEPTAITNRSPFGMEQIIQAIADLSSTGSIRVTLTGAAGTAQEVLISHVNDSINLGDGTTALTSGAVTDNALMIIQKNTLVPRKYDYIAYTSTNATTDTYVYKTGGSGGTTVATVTIVWTDSNKTQVSTTAVT